jgi:hypothetical protein
LFTFSLKVSAIVGELSAIYKAGEGNSSYEAFNAEAHVNNIQEFSLYLKRALHFNTSPSLGSNG